MVKVVAIGDVHAAFGRLWQALKRAQAADEALLPTPPVRDGRYRVVLLGDLIHPKTHAQYTRLTGLEPYNPQNPTHLKAAARAQVRSLWRIKRYVEAAQGHAVVLLGNHEAAVLERHPLLGNHAGIVHAEFDPDRGGLALPEELQAWIRAFPREYQLYGVHFAHVGPAPWLQRYDAMFYQSDEAKRWWATHPEYLARMGYRFGVYGHTVMHQGIQVLEPPGIALIDALDLGQYLELVVGPEVLRWRVVSL